MELASRQARTRRLTRTTPRPSAYAYVDRRERQAKQAPQPASESLPLAPVKRECFQLIGASFRNEPNLRYLTKVKSDAAKDTPLEDWQTPALAR
jgi:hypothetical protein